MTQLEERLRSALHATAERLPDARLASPPPAPPRRFRGLAVAAAAMAVVLVLFGGVAWLLRTDGPREIPPAGTLPRYPIPQFVPQGFDHVAGSYVVPDPANPALVRAVVAQVTTDGFVDAVLVNVVDSPESAGYESGEPVTVGGLPAWLLPSDGTGTTVWWSQGDDVIWVHATNGDSELAIAIAEAVTFVPGADFSAVRLSIGDLPDGFTVLAAPQVAPTEPHPNVTMVSERMGERGQLVSVEVSTEGPEHIIASVGQATTTQVRGHEGYSFSRPGQFGLVWVESPGVTVKVVGTLDFGQIRAIAEQLELTSRELWETELGVMPGVQMPTTTLRG